MGRIFHGPYIHEQQGSMIITAIGILVLLISVAGAAWRVGRSAPDQPRQVRVLQFMLYFWVFAFVQLVLAAIGYAVLVK
jgi:hypothetical protein